MSDNQYLSFYIYYSEPWEYLLTQAVKPLVEGLIIGEMITQYFFIRYWERGPHIRLRLKKNVGINEAELSDIISEKLNSFILKNPSELLLTSEMEVIRRTENWRKNNQVLAISYEPETDRYGGAHAIALAELQFFASSRMVLNELSENKMWTYDDALGVAIKLQVGFIFAQKFSREYAVDFFRKICRDWLPEDQKEERIEKFKAAYELQKSVILPYIQGVLEELRTNPQGLNASWENWLTINRSVYSHLQLLEENSLFKPSMVNSTEPKLWNILGDFIHLTNNRLGVKNRDEAFLAFMLAEALSSF